MYICFFNVITHLILLYRKKKFKLNYSVINISLIVKQPIKREQRFIFRKRPVLGVTEVDFNCSRVLGCTYG